MYRKRADQQIIRDVRLRLAAMNEPDWREAVSMSWASHPELYRHHQFIGASIEQLLAEAGVDLLIRQPRMHFIGNLGPVEEA